MRISERTQNKLLKQDLENVERTKKAVESEVMFDGKDPTDKVCADLRWNYEDSKNNAEAILHSHKANIWKKVSSRLPLKPVDYDEDRVVLKSVLYRLQSGYQTTSALRQSFETISFLAYMTDPPVRTDTYSRVATTEWTTTFQLIPMHNTSEPLVWDLLEYNDRDFHQWWSIRQDLAEFKSPVGKEWKDVKALSGGIVILLAYFEESKDLCEGTLFNEFKLLTERFKDLGNSLSDVLTYPDHFRESSEFFGYFAPVVFVGQKTMDEVRSYLLGEHKPNGSLAMFSQYYRRKVACLLLLAGKLLEKKEDTSVRLYKTGERHETVPGQGKLSAQPCQVDEVEDALVRLDALALNDVTVFENDLGLRQLTLSNSRGRQLGFGSFYVVYERYTADAKTCYAVKEPARTSSLLHDTIWNRVGREAQIWRLLDHENIIPLRGFCLLPDNIPGLVLEACGWNLKEYSRSFNLREKNRLELLRGVANGLAYLHARKIAHGDLRASNILVRKDKHTDEHVASLTDFSISYFVDGGLDPLLSESMFETTRQQVGNPNWLSPELLRRYLGRDKALSNEGPCISLKGDIYSFGCVFLEVMFQLDPYQTFETEEEKQLKKLEGHLPATINDTSATYYPFLRTLWDPEPGCRPSAEHVIAELDVFLSAFL